MALYKDLAWAFFGAPEILQVGKLRHLEVKRLVPFKMTESFIPEKPAGPDIEEFSLLFMNLNSCAFPLENTKHLPG